MSLCEIHFSFESRTPVKLANIKKVVSKNKPGCFDVKIKGDTQITTPQRKLYFRFDSPQTSNDTVKTLQKAGHSMQR